MTEEAENTLAAYAEAVKEMQGLAVKLNEAREAAARAWEALGGPLQALWPEPPHLVPAAAGG